MTTLYELLGIDENSDNEIIKAAYSKKMEDPNITDKKKNQLRIAVDILLNEAKRTKYNNDLANYRAQELLKGLNVKDDISSGEENVNKETPIEKKVEEAVESQDKFKSLDEYAQNVKNNAALKDRSISGPKLNNPKTSEQPVSTTIVEEQPKETVVDDNKQRVADEVLDELDKAKRRKEELEQLQRTVNEEEYKKILKKQEALDKKERKRKEREYKEKYQEAYVTELRSRGYDVKYPWTWKRVKNLLITVIVVVVVCFIAWQIPAVRNPLVEIYETNGIVRMLVNMVFSIFKGIFGIFKKN